MKIKFRFANSGDADLYFKWANDDLVRKNSYQSEAIVYENHVNWFNKRLKSESTFFYLFLSETQDPVGQVRIERTEKETIIGISIDEKYRGKGLGTEMLLQASDDFLVKYPSDKIVAYIKTENMASYKIFEKAGFRKTGIEKISGIESYKLIKTKP